MRHNPIRGLVLTSNPPQYYCVDDDGNRNPCYCHVCDWDGWAPQSEDEMHAISNERLLRLFEVR